MRGFFIFALGCFFVLSAHAAEVADVNSTTNETRPDDFSAEYDCAHAINTKFGANNEYGPLFATPKIASKNVIVVPSVRRGLRGYYSLTLDKGVEFHVFKPQARPDQIEEVYLIQMFDPVTKERVVASIEDAPGIGTTFYFTNAEFERRVRQKAIDMPGSAASDEEARSSIQSVMSSDIRNTPDGVAHCLNRGMPEEEMIKVLHNIVCNCSQIELLKKDIEQMLNDRRVKSLRNRIFCEVSMN